MSLSDFYVLFKADLILKDFSRKPSVFKYLKYLNIEGFLEVYSSLCEPCICACLTLYLIGKTFNTFANRANPEQAALEDLPDQDLLCLLM